MTPAGSSSSRGCHLARPSDERSRPGRPSRVVVLLAALTSCVQPALRRTAGREPLPVRADARTGASSSATRHLAVPGFLPSLVVVPSGVDSRPLIVAAHGAGGTPEWECDYWTRLTLGQNFVLCLRGTRINPQAGYYFRDHHALDAELTAALAAAHREFSRILPGSGMYVGFSQGASMGSLIVGKHANELPYVVLIEGFERWNVALGRAFGQRGGKAVLFACGSRECAVAADVSTRALLQAGPRARAAYAQGAGHTPSGQVEALVASNLAWILAGDAAWSR